MSDASRLCVVTAVEIEFNHAAGLLSEKVFSDNSRVCRGLRGNRPVTVLRAGMGAAGFAERFATHLKHNSHDALIVAGLAGGLDPKLSAGDAIVYDRCLDGRNPGFNKIQSIRDEFASILPDDRLSRAIQDALPAAGISSVRGAGLSVSRIIADSQEKLSIGDRSGAAAVDMETFDIWSACRDAGLPFAALRIVLDEADQDLPDFDRAYDAAGRMSAAKMAAALLARPVPAARFLASLRPAMRSFRRSLKAVLDWQLA